MSGIAAVASNGSWSAHMESANNITNACRPWTRIAENCSPVGWPAAGIIFRVTQVIGRPSPRVRARFFDGLADPARLALLDALRDGERTAGEAAVAARLSPSNASKHLACLRECGLVESHQEWRHVHYRLADGVDQMLDATDAFIEQVADRIAACQRPEMRPV
jgi:ArsR family transcriptional regulator, cadmium/lead-responsive transcriptional repressor